MPKPDWSPPIVRDDGVHMHGDHPLNHNMRAASLARAGLKNDPDGIIDADLIAEARSALPAPVKTASGQRRRPSTKKSPTPAPPPKQAHANEPAPGVDMGGEG